ncbi:MAG: nitrite/sulfite reductase [Myxococcota bacterium]|nr:nitrite/sulfite reductase [Myxococcota bacterium]MDW8363836.1 nitrite/sulfite reductase [Myxococcales bacterium]
MGSTWKERLAGRTQPDWEREIDVFEHQIALRKAGRIEERLFAETRLRRGVYGQRYDNGRRHDGTREQSLEFPSGALTKGPETLWDAPGMQRIKIPYGKLGAEQLEVLAELAEEYSDGILHVTTRQDFQLHFVHIDDTPDLMRRLAAVGITTREACGNSVRNVTACPYAGVCATQAFDVTPHAHALAFFLLGHPDAQDFGRKFKIAFSGCRDEPCGLVFFHDLGCIARVYEGRPCFDVYVGGGLGAVPTEAKLLAEALPPEELLPLAQAVSRVFARLGEKQNRARARIKFLVKKLGIDEFRRLVLEERARLPHDPRWTAHLEAPPVEDERPLRPGGPLPPGPYPTGFERWHATNVRPQAQPGYVVATVTLPLGDLTSDQARALASLARRLTGDTLRTTVEQNLAFRWLSAADLPAFYEGLLAIGLHEPGASQITDVTACPGTDTCKLGIASSRGLAAELRRRLEQVGDRLDPAVRELRIKTSGCFNACGQHHVADLGFLGVSRNVGGRRVPHFQLVLGGRFRKNGSAFGLPIGAVPSKNVPRVVERLTERYVAERRPDESFESWVARTGKAAVRKAIEDLLETPRYEVDPSFYSDWGDPRQYSIEDMGVGECAGEVVPFVQFGLAAAERETLEAQMRLEASDAPGAAQLAYQAMVTAATALLRHIGQDVRDADEAVAKFRTHLVEPRLFHDPYAGPKFAHYLLRAHAERPWIGATADQARELIGEASSFVEAAHACLERIARERAAVAQTTPAAGAAP